MPNTLRERFDRQFDRKRWKVTMTMGGIHDFREELWYFIEVELATARREGAEEIKEKMKNELEKSIKWYKETDGTYDDYVLQHNKRIIKALKDKVDFISQL